MDKKIKNNKKIEEMDRTELMNILIGLISRELEIKELEEKNRSLPDYRMLSVPELVEWSTNQGSKISYGMIDRWMKNGELKYVTSGNKRLIRLENFKKFLDGELMEDKDYIDISAIKPAASLEAFKVAV